MNRSGSQFHRPFFALMAGLALSACASVNTGDDRPALDTASRAANVDPVITVSGSDQNEFFGDFNVLRVHVHVPDTLTVSEANSYYPGGDIVWREDPIGDRHAQVKEIVAEGLRAGTTDLGGSRDVILDVVVTRFHALTEKARYTTGGVHAIQFTMRLRDAETDEILAQPKFIKADFDALGGRAAIQAEAKGMTQRRRIVDHLAFVMREQFSSPDGFIKYNNGLIGALNQI